jgi:serine/threonine-protein kinase
MATAVAPGDRQVDLARIEGFRLGAAEVFPSLLEIRCGTSTQVVERRVMQMLVALHRAHGDPVSRDELIARCWGGLAVSDDAITQCASKLRRALHAIEGVEIASVPRIGYRIVGATAERPVQPSGISRRMVLAAGAAVLTVAGGGSALYLLREIGPPGNSVAVLPFASLNSGAGRAYLAEGISEEIRNALGRLQGVKVVGRTSSEAVGSMEATAAARRLQVASVLTGSVRSSPNLVRVAAQLIDGRTGYERWSQTYDLAPGDSLRLQTEIAQSVALALSPKFGREERIALFAGGTANAAANDLYLQAKLAFRLSDTEATFRKVIALCDAAIGIDPNYADAYALKGMAWDAIGSSFVTDPGSLHQAYSLGGAAGRKAIAIAPDVAAGYVAIARSMSGQLNVRGALQFYRMAEPLAGTDPGVESWWIQTLAEIGRTSDALALSERLIGRDPLNAMIFGRRAFAHYFARNFGLAIASSRRALQLAPGLTEQQGLVGDCLSLQGKYEEAAAQYATVPSLDPYRLTGEAILAARTGDHRHCERLLDRLTRSYGDVASFQQAQIHAQRGAHREAFSALARGRSVLDPGLNGLPADPFIDPLRKDRCFEPLLRSLNLASA